MTKDRRQPRGNIATVRKLLDRGNTVASGTELSQSVAMEIRDIRESLERRDPERDCLPLLAGNATGIIGLEQHLETALRVTESFGSLLAKSS